MQIQIIFKIIVFSIIINLLTFPVFAAQEYKTPMSQPALKDYRYITIPSKTLLKGNLYKKISTQTNVKFDTVAIINPFDVYMFEANCIPKDSVFWGYISEIQPASIGRNGYLKITINKLIFPDKQIIPLDGCVWTNNNDFVIGGEFSPRNTFKRSVHKIQGFRNNGIIQLIPDGERIMGKDTILNEGQELIIMLTKDLKLRASFE